MGVSQAGFYQSADSDLDSAERLFKLAKVTKKIDEWINAWIDDSQVYDDEYEYYAEYIADFDIEKAERILNRYSRASIVRAALSKMKTRG